MLLIPINPSNFSDIADWLEVRPEVEMEDVADDGEARHPLLPRGQDGPEYLMRSPVISRHLKLADTGSGHGTTLQVASIMNNEQLKS